EYDPDQPGNSVTITPDMLPLVDSDSFDANLVFTVVDSNATQAGYFTVDGYLLDSPASFTYQDVLDGKVQYHLYGTNADERIDYIDFTVLDSGKTILFPEGEAAYARDGGIYDADGDLQVFRLAVKVPPATGP